MARISVMAISVLACGLVQGQEKNDGPTNEKHGKRIRRACGIWMIARNCGRLIVSRRRTNRMAGIVSLARSR